MHFTDGARNRSRHRCPHREDTVKELTLEEVLRIAGGVPHSAALDEITYRAPQDADRDLLDRERLLGKDACPSETV
ncbi:MAG: hypothetical protein ABIR73_04465 [Usitatibacter sp.]